ncbi:hypothetical protein [Methanobrevibacter sp.]|uniref:hypothetical protein n=1 Tax=Methanobrevibacter sp. TaxID=66852 RepID=UPI00388DA53D
MKTFTSNSYSEVIANHYKEISERRYLFIIFAPEGSKGIKLNETFTDLTIEEWLLPQNQEFEILNIDHDDKIVVVKLI